MKKAIFIDKDGTLIYDVPYNVNPHLIRFTDGAIAGLKKLTQADFNLYIVSNQQGIGLGYFAEKDLAAVKQTLNTMLTKQGITLNGFYYCPHSKDEHCLCRKPQPGLLIEAANEHKLNLRHSWMIGDIAADIQAGQSAGCKTILFDKGYENTWEFMDTNQPDFIVKNLNDAADIILKEETA